MGFELTTDSIQLSLPTRLSQYCRPLVRRRLVRQQLAGMQVQRGCTPKTQAAQALLLAPLAPT